MINLAGYGTIVSKAAPIHCSDQYRRRSILTVWSNGFAYPLPLIKTLVSNVSPLKLIVSKLLRTTRLVVYTGIRAGLRAACAWRQFVATVII